jgi:hypothetical protein
MRCQMKCVSRCLMSRRLKVADGASVLDTLRYVLYEGNRGDLPERLWDALTDPRWKIAHFGLSALGELVGWALPDDFPPRNSRTSKALRSLGFDVVVHA